VLGAQPDAGQTPLAVVPMTVPATTQPPTPVSVTSWQVPFWLLPTFAQLPVQQSAFEKQVSLTCKQYEADAEQVPPMHAPEQQSVLAPHPSPEPRHVFVRAVHLPPEQRPLQH
jgi:hypothetical protein